MSLERFTRKQVVAIDATGPIWKTAELMRAHHVGAVVVTSSEIPVGIVTDRDLALRVVGAQVDPMRHVGSVMTTDLVTIDSGASVDEAFLAMRRAGVRRLPILGEDGTLVGIVSIDDLVVLLSGELSCTVEAVLDNRGP
jgi:CBS domain-containing protein